MNPHRWPDWWVPFVVWGITPTVAALAALAFYLVTK